MISDGCGGAGPEGFVSPPNTNCMNSCPFESGHIIPYQEPCSVFVYDSSLGRCTMATLPISNLVEISEYHSSAAMLRPGAALGRLTAI